MSRTLPAVALLLSAALGCQDEPDGAPAGAAAEPEDAPTAYTYEAEQSAAPQFDPDVIELALDDTVTRLMTIQAEPVLAAYDAAMARTEDGCPEWYDFEGNAFWYAYCTTDEGTLFNGYGFYTLYEDADLLGDGRAWDGVSINGAATVRDTDGSVFHLGGGVFEGTGVGEDGSRGWFSQVAGAFVWDAEEAEGTWLQEGMSPSLLLYAQQWDMGGGVANYVYAEGALGGLSGAATAVDLGTFVVAHQELGLACEIEPYGELAVRDDAGVWWDVRFDYDEDGRFSGDCDGCGGAWLNGDYQGEVCADFSPLLDWEARPW